MSAPLKHPISDVRAEVDLLIELIRESDMRRQITDAWLDDRIDGDRAMTFMTELGLLEFTRQETPKTRDIAAEAWTDARVGFARLNRQADARRGLVLA